jgi:hypothetical protein
MEAKYQYTRIFWINSEYVVGASSSATKLSGTFERSLGFLDQQNMKDTIVYPIR